MRIAVIADSHFHAEDEEGRRQHGYPSDARFNARNRAAVAELIAARPALVVHLGDVPHPIPGLRSHARALDEAQATYAALPVPLRMVPGNHDVGDKPHPWALAPSVSPEKHAVFQARWGPPWWREDLDGDISLLGLDTPVLNSGLPLESAQWAWLEAQREGLQGRRIFVFLHYPPFLLHPDEDEHYDNLAEPARGRLLELFAALRVEAVFCGHVHHPFLHERRGTRFYLLPSTAFVRPGFAELARIGPGEEGKEGEEPVDCEHGRNQRGRLGWALLHIEAEGHRVEWVRSEGRTEPRAWAPGLGPGEPAPSCPLGLTLRHAWDAVEDIPADNLDPYRRKRARNDLGLLAAMGLGPGLLRLPLSDLRHPPSRERLDLLRGLGFRFVFFTADPLGPGDLAALDRPDVEALEWIAPRGGGLSLPALPVPLWCSVHPRAPVRDEARFDHFPLPGYLPEDPDPAGLPGRPVLRLPQDRCPLQVALAAPEGAVLLVELPRAGEARAFTDDLALAHRLARAVLAARARPDLRLMLDGFMDHDRGYFPRHGLVDRRGDPRPAWWVLRHLSRLWPAGRPEASDPEEGGLFRLPDGPALLLPRRPTARGLDLVLGRSGGPANLHPRLLG